MKIKFWKMHGAGNDFILVDDRAGVFPVRDRRWISRACSRHDGIGSEGLILLQKSGQASFFMRFFNPDGSGADMCGNGLRCAARLALDLGIAGRKMTIETRSGILNASVAGTGVRVSMPLASDARLAFPVRALGRRYICSLINTGVPHLVIATGNLEAVDLPGLGPALRYHRAFAPAGTNVDFMQVTGRHSIAVRTYERGVEAETPACGTGITACAVVAALLGKAQPPVRVKCRHGDMLEVDFTIRGNGVEDIALAGPAKYVFSGEILYP
ncbi:MAG: diaminopimelate epimerase [Kiritimatiellia bacterium]